MQYTASVCKSIPGLNAEASTSQQSTESGEVDEQSNSASSHDPFPNLEPTGIVPFKSQAVQVNFPNKGADFGCQVNTHDIQLMMKSRDSQTPCVNVSNASTQSEEGDIPEQNIAEEAVLSISPEVSPQKDGTYCPSRSESFSDYSLSKKTD